MNHHNFLQFNPNCYKKHFSPLGRGVLDNLIKHWRIGFDSNENRRHHQLANNQNRRQYSRGIHTYPRSIPSIPSDGPSSPGREINDERGFYRPTDNFESNYLMPPASDQPFPKHTVTDYTNEINHSLRYDDDHNAVPRSSPGVHEPSTFLEKNDNEKYLHKHIATSNSLINHQHQVNNPRSNQRKIFSQEHMNQVLVDVTNHESPNEAVLKFSDLRKTIEIPNTFEDEILTANDIITPVINFNEINEKLLSSKKYIDPKMHANTFLEILNKERNCQNNQATDVVNIGHNTVMKNVDWEDMFDTELFQNLEPDGSVPLKTPLAGDQDIFKIDFPKDKKRKQQSDNKVTKRKAEIKTNKTLTKQVKNAICQENLPEKTLKMISKKISHTKAIVSNWLEDVNPNHLREGEIQQYNHSEVYVPKITSASKIDSVGKNNHGSKGSSITIDIEIPKDPAEHTINTSETLLLNAVELNKHITKETNVSKTMIPDKVVLTKESFEKVVEKKPKGKNKKVVQARLAEKDGKMKFGPPAKGQSESKIDVLKENEPQNKDTVKDKKVKSKFVPPIKSQVPIKNITFDVMTIDEGNLQIIQELTSSEGNEIVMILVYKNGYCQLNNHHTEETCVSEGVMVHSHDKFFYFQDTETNGDLLENLLRKPQVVCYNGKQMLINLISKYGLELKQDVFSLFDVKIGGSLIDPDNPPENFAELQKLLGFTPEFTIATECALQKAAWYMTLLRECFDKLKCFLIENSVWNVFIEIEMPLLPVIAGMEYRGVRVDLDKLKSMEDTLLTKMKLVEQECYKAAGKTFQINSTVQVRTILYDELQLDTKSNLKIKETIGKGAKSTSETMLRGLVSAHPLPRLILEYRHLHKAHATFLTGIAQHVKDGSVRPTWVQMAAATGRIASNNPNLQAIPKAPFSLVVFPQNSDDQEPTLNFRSVYIARPGHFFLAADFKHIECRVFAHAADDATLQDALRTGHDLFRVLAAKWLNKSLDDVSSEDRERTKRVVYASLYGAGARKLMEILHVSYEQALSIMSSFNRTFPALKSFGRAVVEKATSGALRTLCGRVRRLPNIASTDAVLRAQAERQAVNFIVQGSAADLCKKAMVAVQRRLEAVPSRLVLQIHDELVWEVAEDHVNIAAEIIKDAMENVGRGCGMGMSLPVELTCGRNWGEMRPLHTS